MQGTMPGARRCTYHRPLSLKKFIHFSFYSLSPYSIIKRRVPDPIPVLGSQPAGDVSH